MTAPAILDHASAPVLADFDESKITRDRRGRFSRNPGGGIAGALAGQAALDSAPVRLTRPPGGHGGDYTGADITGPEGHGSALALAEMVGVEHEVTNSYLRRGSNYDGARSDMSELAKANDERIAEVDKSMAVSRLPEPVVVYRGVKDGSQMFPENIWYGSALDGDTLAEQDANWERWEAGYRPDLTGVTWEEKAYAHTTVIGERLSGYARRLGGMEPVAMTIIVPAGTGAVHMSTMEHEAELMLERGLSFRVVADNGVDAGGVRRLDVEVLPRA
jgi:hypothetical protein